MLVRRVASVKSSATGRFDSFPAARASSRLDSAGGPAGAGISGISAAYCSGAFSKRDLQPPQQKPIV
jgi:hypothetical protein